MRVTKLAEVFDLEDQEVIMAVSGTITELYKQTKGGTDDKPWAVQNGVIKDGQDTMRFAVWNKDPLPQSMRGKKVTFLSFQGKKGWTGVFAHDNEYKGKTTRELKLTQAAEIVEAGSVNRSEDGDGDEGEQLQRQRATQREEREEQPAERPAQHSRSDDLLHTKQFILRRMSGLKICHRAVWLFRDELKAVTGEEMSNDQFQAMVSTLFIAGDKAGQFDMMHTDLDYSTMQPRKKPEPKEVAEPEPEETRPKKKTSRPAPRQEPEEVQGDDVPM